MERTLIVGIASGVGRLIARRIAQRGEVAGVDTERWPGRPPDVPLHPIDRRGRGFAEIIRATRPDVVVHAGLWTAFGPATRQRHTWNARATRALLDACLHHGVSRVVVLTSSHVYGALPDNPGFMDEDYPVLAGGQHPDFQDLVEADAHMTAFMWRHPELHTCVLRAVPTLGFHSRGSVATYLRRRRVVTVMGFNPVMQFLHEEDLVEAVVLAADQGLRGVFNVVGGGEVPLDVAIRESGARRLSLPEPLAARVLRRSAAWPRSAVPFLKFSCTVSGQRFVDATGYRPLFSLRETFRALR